VSRAGRFAGARTGRGLRGDHSGLMSFLEGSSEVLDRLVTEMYARGLSTRDVEDAFRDATGELD
jgi:transposase-like protein